MRRVIAIVATLVVVGVTAPLVATAAGAATLEGELTREGGTFYLDGEPLDLAPPWYLVQAGLWDQLDALADAGEQVVVELGDDDEVLDVTGSEGTVEIREDGDGPPPWAGGPDPDGQWRAEDAWPPGPPPFVLEMHPHLAERFGDDGEDGEDEVQDSELESTEEQDEEDEDEGHGPPEHAGEPGPPEHAGKPGPPDFVRERHPHLAERFGAPGGGPGN